MAYSFADLIQPMTRQEVQTAIYSALTSAGVNTTSWKTGAVVRTMIVSVSAVIAALTTLKAQIARSGFLEFAAGDWLAIVARYVYDVEREPASFATGTVTLDNEGGGVFEIEAAGDFIVSHKVTGKSYRNTAPFTLGALQIGVVVPVSAVEIGSGSDAEADDLTVLTTPLPGVECSNEGALSARDEETDPELRARCKERLGALSPMGPWDAYSYAVKTAKRTDTLASLGITRVRLTKDGFGNVTVYLATGEGGVQPSDVALAQDAIERKAVPQAVTATAVSATPKIINVAQEVWAYNTSALTPEQIEEAIYVKLRDYLALQPVGGNDIEDGQGRIYTDVLRSVTNSAIPSLVIRTQMATPAGDSVTLAAFEVPVIGTVLTTLHQVPAPEGHAP